MKIANRSGDKSDRPVELPKERKSNPIAHH